MSRKIGWMGLPVPDGYTEVAWNDVQPGDEVFVLAYPSDRVTTECGAAVGPFVVRGPHRLVHGNVLIKEPNERLLRKAGA